MQSHWLRPLCNLLAEPEASFGRRELYFVVQRWTICPWVLRLWRAGLFLGHLFLDFSALSITVPGHSL